MHGSWSRSGLIPPGEDSPDHPNSLDRDLKNFGIREFLGIGGAGESTHWGALQGKIFKGC